MAAIESVSQRVVVCGQWWGMFTIVRQAMGTWHPSLTCDLSPFQTKAFLGISKLLAQIYLFLGESPKFVVCV